MNNQDILSLISRLGDLQNVRVNGQGQNSNNNPILNTVCTLAGNYLVGPTGMVIAGLAGTALSTIFSQNQNQNQQRSNGSRLSDIIENQMNDQQRMKLAQMVRKIMRDNPNSTNITSVMSNDNLRNSLINSTLGFVQNMDQNSSGSSSSNRFNYRQRLGSNSRVQSNRSCGSSCCRRGSCS